LINSEETQDKSSILSRWRPRVQVSSVPSLKIKGFKPFSWVFFPLSKCLHARWTLRSFCLFWACSEMFTEYYL